MADYTNLMGNRRQGNYPMTQGIRRQMMPNSPNAPNGRPVGQSDSVQRKRRGRNEAGMLNDPMKGSLSAKVDRIMERNPDFNRENVMARQSQRMGLDTTQEGFDPNRLRQPDERQLLAEQRAGAGIAASGGEGQFGTQQMGQSAIPGGMQQIGMAQPGMLQRHPEFDQYMGRMGQPGIPQQPNAAYPQIPQRYQSNIRRRPNAEWYKGGGRY